MKIYSVTSAAVWICFWNWCLQNRDHYMQLLLNIPYLLYNRLFILFAGVSRRNSRTKNTWSSNRDSFRGLLIGSPLCLRIGGCFTLADRLVPMYGAAYAGICSLMLLPRESNLACAPGEVPWGYGCDGEASWWPRHCEFIYLDFFELIYNW